VLPPLHFASFGSGGTGTRKLDALSGIVVHIVRGNDTLWRNIVFEPLDERGEHVEDICAWTTLAMVHPRHHEQPVKLLSPLW
jgi:hypothetical protein